MLTTSRPPVCVRGVGGAEEKHNGPKTCGHKPSRPLSLTEMTYGQCGIQCHLGGISCYLDGMLCHLGGVPGVSSAEGELLQKNR